MFPSLPLVCSNFTASEQQNAIKAVTFATGPVAIVFINLEIRLNLKTRLWEMAKTSSEQNK